MISFGAAKGNFFDRQAVLRAVGKMRVRVFSKFGGKCRKIAQRSMRYSKKPSRPGQPPHARRNLPLLRKFLFFSYDPAAKSVVIGPTLISSSTAGAPRIHEFGGKKIVRQGFGVTINTYPPRPFMRPAFEIALRDMPAMFRDQLRPA